MTATEDQTLTDKAVSSTAVVEGVGSTDDKQKGVDASVSQPSAKKGVEETLADVVKKAAEASLESPTEEEGKTVEAKESEKEEPTDESQDQKVEEEKETEKVVAEELPPFHKHPRWQAVVKERDDLKATAEALKPVAERTQAVEAFCNQHGVSQEEFRGALEVAALLHVNPQEAYKRLKEVVEGLELGLGQRLPADLQAKVDEGKVDEETAKELAAKRIQTASGQRQQVAQSQQAMQRQQQEMVVAVNAWHESKQKVDPDFAQKYELIKDRFLVFCQGAPPKTAAEAVAHAEKAYADVVKMVGSFVPKPPRRKILTSTGSSVNGEATMKLDNMNTDLIKLVRHVAARHA